MTRRQLSELIDSLPPAMEVQREEVLRTCRGHERPVTPGAGAKAKLTSADRVLVTVLHLRKLATMDLLGQLFNTTGMTISRAAKDVRPLLEAHSIRRSMGHVWRCSAGWPTATGVAGTPPPATSHQLSSNDN
ncbi:hypothetical protein QFZ75_000352 [Streptomyces sp. V3I8]|nr:hypothetical protein [Streptomyces sp. V3I8]